MEHKDGNLITTQQAMAISGYSRASWQRLKRKGATPKPVCKIGRNWMYKEEEVRLFTQSIGRA